MDEIEDQPLPDVHDIKYPNDFTNPEMAVIGDEGINRMLGEIEAISLEISTGDAFVTLTELGYVEVYKKIAECEVELPEWASAPRIHLTNKELGLLREIMNCWSRDEDWNEKGTELLDPEVNTLWQKLQV